METYIPGPRQFVTGGKFNEKYFKSSDYENKVLAVRPGLNYSMDGKDITQKIADFTYLWNVGPALNFPACGEFCTKPGPGSSSSDVKRTFFQNAIYKFKGLDSTKDKCYVYTKDDDTAEYNYYDAGDKLGDDPFIELSDCPN